MKVSRSFSLSQLVLVFLGCTVFPTDGVWAQSGAVRPRTSTATTSPSSQPVPQGPLSVGQSTLTGRVIYQDNELPLKGVRVRIFKPTGVERPLVAFANNNGEFRVEKLAAGKYYVTVEGEGIAAPSGMGMRLPLPIRAIPKREDFEEIIPRHDAAFSADGTNAVTLEIRIKRGGSVSGKVLRPDGSPAGNVQVSLISREQNGGPVTSQFTGHTDKNGVFRVDNVPAADYLVAAAVDDTRANLDIRARMRGEGRVVTYHPAATSANDATHIRVAPGQETSSVNITLVSRATYEVSGTVLRQRDGTPIAGAEVLLRNRNSEMSGPRMPGLSQRSTQSDTQGNWSFPSVLEGDYIVTALAPIVRPRPPDAGEPDRERQFRESRQPFLVKHQDIVVSGTDLQGLSLAISGPGSIRGTVETDDGAVLPGDLVIFLELVTENDRPARPLPVKVAADGAFQISDIQAGDVFLSAAFPSGSKYIVESVMTGGNNLKRTPLQVVEGADAGPVRIRISSGLAMVSGRVLSKSGEGLAGWVVLVVPAEASEQRFRTSILSGRTDAVGSFRISGVPGDYFIFARKRDELPGILTPDFFKKGVLKPSASGSNEENRPSMCLWMGNNEGVFARFPLPVLIGVGRFKLTKLHRELN